MQIPQALPIRTVEVSSDDPGALASVQPERGREYVQLERGSFEGALRERSTGRIGLIYEHWSRGVRVRCARPRSYIAFSAVTSESAASWCGLELQPGSVLEVEHDWEMTTRGSLASFSLGIEYARLEAVEVQLADGSPERNPHRNRVLSAMSSRALAAVLRSRVQLALSLGALLPEARQTLEDDLTHLAARLRREGRLDPARPESESHRRRAVRRVEEYLDAHEREVPSVATLCAVAGVSERTLEYAFREQIGVPPVRYLRMRRLNAVRRELLHGEPGAVRVTDVAMRWGFWELGRFAQDYRALFGERPSATLASPRLGLEVSQAAY